MPNSSVNATQTRAHIVSRFILHDLFVFFKLGFSRCSAVYVRTDKEGIKMFKKLQQSEEAEIQRGTVGCSEVLVKQGRHVVNEWLIGKHKNTENIFFGHLGNIL